MDLANKHRGLWIALTVGVIGAAVWWWNRGAPESPSTPDASAQEAATGGRRDWNDDEPRRKRLGFDRRPGQIEGRVIDAATGEVAPHVDVLFWGRGGERTFTSDAQGEYVAQLDPGTYQVGAAGDGVVGLPAASIRITGSDDPIRYDVRVARSARVSGRVVDGSGRAVAGATVSFAATTEVQRKQLEVGTLAASTSSDDDGRFELDVIPGDQVLLQAVAGSRRGHAEVPQVTPGSGRTDVLITLPDAAVVAGVVLAPGGAPIPGARVHVEVHGGAASHGEGVETDARGRFEIQAMPGDATVEAQAEGYARSEPIVVAITAGQRHAVDVLLEAPRVIAGRVLDPAGKPVSEARVRAGRTGSRMGRLETYTDDDGRYAFREVNAGPYWVGAFKAGFAVGEVRDVRPPIEDLQIRLVVHGGIRGRVLDAAGKPVRSFEVTIESFKMAGQRKAVPVGKTSRHGDGAFELSNLEPGSYELRIAGDGGKSRTVRVEVPAAGHAQADVTLD